MDDGWAGPAPVVLQRWDDVLDLLAGAGVATTATRLFVLRGRCRAARDGGVRDDESGCILPGLPALQLSPPTWWAGEVGDWAARQVSHHVAAQEEGGSVPVVTGRTVGRGWDGEPLLDRLGLVAVLAPVAVAQAVRHYRGLQSGRWPAATAGAPQLLAL